MADPRHPRDGFRPAPWLRGAHLQTIVPTLLPAPAMGTPDEEMLVEVAAGNRLRILIARPQSRPRGTLVLVHGLGGSAASGYMIRTARMALEAGWVAVRVNLRNCGGTERLATTLYNAGQSEDVGRVLEELKAARLPGPLALVGFSLGGNLVLRYAGLAGATCLAEAMVAVNPPVDLEACVRCLEEPRNSLYQAYFTWRLCRLLKRIRRVRKVPGPAPLPWRVGTVRRFDACYTAPDGGYSSAEEYYGKASAGPHLASLQVPTLLLSALDDPFVSREVFAPHQGTAGGRLHLVQPPFGGHVGYWQAGRPRFWAGRMALNWVEAALGAGNPSTPESYQEPRPHQGSPERTVRPRAFLS